MIFVSPLSLVEEAVRAHRPSHLISLLDPASMIDTPGHHAGSHLKVGVNDIAEHQDGRIAPGEAHVRDILDYVAGWRAERPMLVHCWAGISRSTATAFITLCLRHAPGEEGAIARAMRKRAPHAQPNRLLIAHADRLMGRGGRMVQAVELMGPAEPVWEGVLFDLPAPLVFED